MSFCNVAETLINWHEKLTHVHFEHVKQVLNENYIKFEDRSNSFFKSCLYGKEHPVSKKWLRGTVIGELVHTDLCGPFEGESVGGTRNKAKNRKVYCIFNTQSRYKIETLRADNRLELTNKDVDELRSTKGIKHYRPVFIPQNTTEE